MRRRNPSAASGTGMAGDSCSRLQRNGARMGDLFMSLIHTAELRSANPFDYLTCFAPACAPGLHTRPTYSPMQNRAIDAVRGQGCLCEPLTLVSWIWPTPVEAMPWLVSNPASRFAVKSSALPRFLPRSSRRKTAARLPSLFEDPSSPCRLTRHREPSTHWHAMTPLPESHRVAAVPPRRPASR
jgi:hypothetical protein